MSLNSVAKTLKQTLLSFRRHSITLRLTVLYAISTFCALLASSIFLYHVLVEDLYHSDVKVIANEIKLVKNVLLQHRGKVIMLDPQSNERKAYFIRVLDDKGGILLETPDMSLQFNRDDFAPSRYNGALSKAKTVQSIDHRYYMTQTAKLLIPGKDAYYLTIQMALDTNHHHTVKQKYQIRLAIIIFFGIFISALLGAFIAYRGMKPLRQVTESIQAISVNQLDARIAPNNWPAELIALIDAFNALLTRIERSFNQLKQFSADIAHELRTPLHHLMVETEICLANTRSENEYKETLQSSLEEYNKLAQLIDRLLFLARAENPATAIKLSPVDIEQEFAALREFYNLACEEKQITLDTQGQGTVMADPILFRRAINNLLTNAIKHTPHNGHILLAATENADTNIIAVHDSGIGIAAEHLPKLFDRFYRVDYARSKQAGGHGLGLAIVKSIMDLHHGKVTVNSVPDEGSSFTLFFPKHP